MTSEEKRRTNYQNGHGKSISILFSLSCSLTVTLIVFLLLFFHGKIESRVLNFMLMIAGMIVSKFYTLIKMSTLFGMLRNIAILLKQPSIW